MMNNMLGCFCLGWWEKVGRQSVKGGREGEKREKKISLSHHKKRKNRIKIVKIRFGGIFYTVNTLECSEKLGEKCMCIGGWG